MLLFVVVGTVGEWACPRYLNMDHRQFVLLSKPTGLNPTLRRYHLSNVILSLYSPSTTKGAIQCEINSSSYVVCNSQTTTSCHVLVSITYFQHELWVMEREIERPGSIDGWDLRSIERSMVRIDDRWLGSMIDRTIDG